VARKPIALNRRFSVPVHFDLSRNTIDTYNKEMERALQAHPGGAICDIGAGANPTFPIEHALRNNVAVTLLDISSVELAKAPSGYRTIVADIADPTLDVSDRFDVVCSRMLAEHVRDARVFHTNVHRLLRPGGHAIHFFPTLWTLPFVVNRFVPESLASRLFRAARTGRDPWREGKFPAYYRMCRGPTPRQLRGLTNLGFEVLDYYSFFGHAYYVRLPILQALQERWARALVRRPVPHLTSYAIVVLGRP
jgi:SAM-dependent methyltransferase